MSVNVDKTNQASDELLTADAAAAHLGVSRPTLYAYVSRGLLRSEPGPGPSRARRYPRAALEELLERRERGRDPALAAQGALHWGLPVLDSAITLIEDGRLYYRGRDAIELSRTARFEEVAALLWTGTQEEEGAALFAGAAAPAAPPPAGALAGALAAHLAQAGERALTTVGSPPPARLRGAARAVAELFAAAGASGAGSLAERLARGWRTPAAADLDAALILCADHELNISAFTARCVASADAALEHVLLAALCAMRGRRHGGMVERVEALIADAERDGPEPALRRALGEGESVPGFGHPLHRAGDPRGAELLRRAGLDPQPSAADPDPAAALVGLALERLGLRPTLDLGLVVLARRLGLPAGAAFALFALGRSAGWTAHALETWEDRRLIRPRSRYTGPAPSPTTRTTE
jgi:citrate synthase